MTHSPPRWSPYWAAGAETRGLGPVTLADPNTALAALLGGGGGNFSGESVTEASALGLSAFYRAVVLIADALASCPLKSYRTLDDGERERVGSFLDQPGGVGSPFRTPFAWKERVGLHLAIHNDAFLLHRLNNGGGIFGLYPIHPLAVTVEEAPQLDEHGRSWPNGRKYIVQMKTGPAVAYNSDELTHIIGPSTDGLRGLSLLTVARNSLGTGIAADRSAARQFSKGALIPGVLTPREGEDLNTADIQAIKSDLETYVYGSDNAGSVPIINRMLEFQPWAMSNADAEFLASRGMQIDEVSRWTGVPLHKLGVRGATSNWGTGIAEQNRGWAQEVLNPLALRIQEPISLLLPQPRFAEFDLAGLEAGSARDEIKLLMDQVNGGFLTLNEARRIRNLPPVEGGDVIRTPSGVMLLQQLLTAPQEVPSVPGS